MLLEKVKAYTALKVTVKWIFLDFLRCQKKEIRDFVCIYLLMKHVASNSCKSRIYSANQSNQVFTSKMKLHSKTAMELKFCNNHD